MGMKLQSGRWFKGSPFRIYLMTIAVAGLPLAIFLISAHQILVRQANDRLKVQSEQAVGLVGDLIERNLTNSRVLVESFSTRPNLLESFKARDFKEVTKHLEQASLLREDFLFFSVYDLDGTLRAIYPQDPGVLNRNFAFRDWYKGVRRTGKPYISEVYSTAVAGNFKVVAIAVPLRDEKGRTIGILMAPQKIDALLSDVRTLSSPKSTAVLSLVDQSGHVFGNPKASVARIDRDQPISPELVEQVGKGARGSRLHRLNGRDMFVAYHPIESLHWGVLLEVPPEAIKKAIWDYEKNLVLLAVVVIAFAVGGGGFVANLYSQLKDSEQQTRLVIEKAHDAFIAMDSKGKITEWNPQAEKTFGWSKDEAKGRLLEELIIPEAVREQHHRGLEHFLRTGEGPLLNRSIETMALRRSGEEFPVQLSISPARHGAGIVFNSFLRDITESKRYQERIETQNRELDQRNREVERATRLKSQFLANVSHELRTPLNAIIGFSDLLVDGTPGPLNEKQRRFLGHVKNSGKHLLQLINDILDLSKIEAGRVELQLEDLSIETVVHEVISNVRSLAMVKGIELQLELAADSNIHADRVRLKQVFYNLLSNAIKFTPENGTIVICCRRDGEKVITSVQDNGPGIPPADLEMIFDEFRQSENAMKESLEGTGLGLAITKRLIEDHSGTIWVESAVGRGTCFSFALPYCPVRQHAEIDPVSL